MKNTLTLITILFIFSVLGYSQTRTTDTLSVNDSLKSQIIKPILLNKKDTLNFDVNSEGKEISIKFIESETTDYFKYIFPILTLLLGIGVNRLIDYLSDKKKIKKTAKRWLIELQNLKIPLEKQIESIDEYLSIHKKEEFKVPSLKAETYLDCESFNSLDKTELLKYLEDVKDKEPNVAMKDVNRINSYITVVRHHYETLKEKFIDYKNGTSIHVTNLSKDIQELLKAFAFYGVELEEELNADPSNDARYLPLLNLFESEIRPYMQSGDYDVFNLEKDFFVPILSVLSTFRFDKRTHSMTESVRNCINDIKGIKMERNYLATNFENIRKRLEENKNEISDIYKPIE